jgi:sugar phosphate isomerase/epimerase
MDSFRIGLQLYCLRDACAADFEAAVASAGRMGYQGVEFAGYFGRSAAAIRKLLADNGLAAAGSHVPFESLLGDELDRSIGFHLEAGIPLLVVPGLQERHRANLDAWKRTADEFNRIAERLAPHGLRLGYHNHTIELVQMDGKIPLEWFFSLTRAEVVTQIDTGLVVEAGADPLAFLNRFPGRGRSLHVKEWSSRDPDAYLGDGEVPWTRFLSACRQTGVPEWFIVEYERPRGEPAENVRICLENFRRLASNPSD